MMNTNKELKSCPFCGGHNVKKNLVLGLKWLVGCDDCGCRTAEYNYSVDAVCAWNRRASDQEEAKHISAIMSEIMSRGYPDDDFEENHMSMPMPVEGTPF